MWQFRSQRISSPGWVCAFRQTWLDMVPDGTKRAASLPSRAATRSCRRRTVGSSPKTSSPTSAAAMAARMPGVGLVTVSLRKSMSASGMRFSDRGLSLSLLQKPPLAELLHEDVPADEILQSPDGGVFLHLPLGLFREAPQFLNQLRILQKMLLRLVHQPLKGEQGLAFFLAFLDELLVF